MSTIIKASGPLRASDGLPFNFDDMTDRAKGYLDQVRRQAAEILAQAEQDAIAIRHRAEEQGRAAALEAAHKILEEKVSRQLTTLVPALRQAIDHIHAARAGWLGHWEKTAIHVAAAMAARVIRRELTSHPEITLALVKEALELAAGSGEIQLRLHPADFEALGTQIERLTAELSRLGKAHIVADAQITAGGCRIDTRYGMIDQQFEAQLARIEQELT
jgi:flagellar biosynthesis/type III secretory pathway protein FliH